MRIFEENFPIEIHPGLLPGKASETVFFDIETTGFSGQSAYLYLIGCIFFNHKTWRIRQWFLDDPTSEKELLLSFFDFIGGYTWLVHFNGSAFDIPFIEKRLERYRLAKSFSFFESLDLYKEIRAYKKPLGLASVKQKELEEYLGIRRADPFSGGELIDVYYEYIDTHREALLSCLLLHNADDLRGMLSILPLYGLALLLKGDFAVRTCIQGTDSLDFCLDTELPLPPSAKLSFCNCRLTVQSGQITAQVPLAKETMKYFYTNYKDYYYLPDEDQAIHKSVAAFVDRAHRKAATPASCYAKRSSVFLPVKDREFTSRIFRREYKEKTYFLELTRKFLDDKELQRKYLLQLFM